MSAQPDSFICSDDEANFFSLLEINSERDDSKVDTEHPFGPGPVKALEKFLEIADRDGYPTKNVDNYAGHFEFGDGEEVLGIFAHMDVVPAGSGWDTDPYTPTIKDGRLYARGASDDKGPTTACYYGLKIIKELGLPTSKKFASSSEQMKNQAGQTWTTTSST